MKRKLKITIAGIGCLAFAWGSCMVALFAQMDEEPVRQGIFALVAGLMFFIAVLFAGWGNSLCKKNEESNGEH